MKLAFSFDSIGRTILLALPFLCASPLVGQQDSLASLVEQFKQSQQANHKVKYLNIDQRELGGLPDTEPAYYERFMLESKEEFENKLGYTTERDVYFDVLGYRSERDRQYALEYWMEEFIEGSKLRPARPMRSLRYAVPTIILINPQSIVVCSFDCKYYTEEHFEHWKEVVWNNFAADEDRSMMIEILCDGPVEWTENAPDPKVRGLF